MRFFLVFTGALRFTVHMPETNSPADRFANWTDREIINRAALDAFVAGARASVDSEFSKRVWSIHNGYKRFNAELAAMRAERVADGHGDGNRFWG